MTERACPICKKPSVAEYRPFCSGRCANVDLQRWLTGRYSLVGDDEDEPGASWAEDLDPTPLDR
jgi:endogenous inhibitor of DNA gyrase (YacG/DUF329 family)